MIRVSVCSQRLLAYALFVGISFTGRAAITIGTTNASDGAFSPVASTQVDLSQAVAGAWDGDNTAAAGKGRYDGAKWAVVFKYASVNIPAGVTITFKNHPSHAPVVWLVQGNVTIAGTIKLDGANAANDGSAAEPGPGGFRGGVGGGNAVKWSGGFGYGGGQFRDPSPSGSASYATQGSGSSSWNYGNPGVLQLIGGGGGGGNDILFGGGAGAGAILIACRGTLTLSGAITAHGGTSNQGGGSGGAIRLVSDVLAGAGSLSATGGASNTWSGGDGRIRLEANTSTMTGTSTPAASTGVPIGATPDIFPPSTAPQLVITSVGAVSAPADPLASFSVPGQDVTVASTGALKVLLQATNVPLTWTVIVRVVPKTGTDTYTYASNLSGNAASSVWSATVTFPPGITSLQARAYQ